VTLGPHSPAGKNPGILGHSPSPCSIILLKPPDFGDMKYSTDKMHRIIKKFQQFPLKNGILKDFQRKAGIVTPLNHITDVKTRWNSLVNACKRFKMKSKNIFQNLHQ
jgi:flagellar biosynthesis/type III secretory pathway chaperone